MYLSRSLQWDEMWYKVDFNVGNPKAFTRAKDTNCPNTATDPHPLMCNVGCSLGQLFLGTRQLSLFFPATSLIAVTVTSYNWVELCPIRRRNWEIINPTRHVQGNYDFFKCFDKTTLTASISLINWYLSLPF